MKLRKSDLIPYLLILLALILRLILLTTSYKYFVDDAYIFMRYSENIGAGHGPVYNLGEKVMGFTSISYTAINGLFKVCFRNFPLSLFIKILNQALFLISAVLLLFFLNHFRLIRYAVFIIILFYFPFIDASLSGMESSLFCLLILAVLLAAKKGAFMYASLFATLAFVTRPEGIFLLLPCLVLSYFHMSRRQFLLTLFSIVLFLGAGAVSLWLYYGSCIPHPIIAKSSLTIVNSWAGIQTNPLNKAVLLAIGGSDPSFLAMPSSIRFAFTALTIGCILIVAFHMWYFIKNRPELLLASVFYLLVLVFYIIGKPVRIFSWYTIPTSLCFFIVSFAGIERLLDRWKRIHMQLWIIIVVIIASALSVFVALPYRLKMLNDHVGDLHNLGLKITHNYPESKSVMISDIGIVGYTTGLRMIDLAGLVTPAAFNLNKQKPSIFGDLVDRTSPDIICLKQNPLEKNRFDESSILYQSFRDKQQRDRFLEKYTHTHLGSHICSHVFIRK